MCSSLPDFCINISHRLYKIKNPEEAKALITGILSGLETQKRLLVEYKLTHRDSMIEDYLRAHNAEPLNKVIADFNATGDSRYILKRSDFFGSKYRRGEFEETYYDGFRTGMMYVSNLYFVFTHSGNEHEATIKLALEYYKYVVLWVNDRLLELV